MAQVINKFLYSFRKLQCESVLVSSEASVTTDAFNSNRLVAFVPVPAVCISHCRLPSQKVWDTQSEVPPLFIWSTATLSSVSTGTLVARIGSWTYDGKGPPCCRTVVRQYMKNEVRYLTVVITDSILLASSRGCNFSSLTLFCESMRT